MKEGGFFLKWKNENIKESLAKLLNVYAIAF